jgi:hypothetical protein
MDQAPTPLRTTLLLPIQTDRCATAPTCASWHACDDLHVSATLRRTGTYFGAPLARARDALRFAGGDLSFCSRFFSCRTRTSTDQTRACESTHLGGRGWPVPLDLPQPRDGFLGQILRLDHLPRCSARTHARRGVTHLGNRSWTWKCTQNVRRQFDFTGVALKGP